MIPVDYQNNVFCCDALSFLRALPVGAIQVFITSPPYNFRNSTGNGLKKPHKSQMWNGFTTGYATYLDDMPHEQYITWQRKVLDEMYRLLPDDGAIFYNHKQRVQDGLLQRLPEQIIDGFPLRQMLVWYRNGGINFNRTYFLPTHELIYVIAKPEFKLTAIGQKYHDVWTFEPVANKAHPNSFPGALVERVLIATDARSVCDPFMGSGTVAYEASRRGVSFTGCDIAMQYVTETREKLRNDVSRLPLFAGVVA